MIPRAFHNSHMSKMRRSALSELHTIVFPRTVLCEIIASGRRDQGEGGGGRVIPEIKANSSFDSRRL